MTVTQKQALKAMDDRNIGAVLTCLGWTWPHMIRTSEDAAQAVIDEFARLDVIRTQGEKRS